MQSNLDLDSLLPSLIAQGKKYPGTMATLVPDYVLYGLVTDVREHARAVQLLASSELPRAAFANARSAFESAVDLAYLVADESDYEYRGAQARVAELFELEEIEKRVKPLGVPLRRAEGAVSDLQEAVVIEARDWDARSPGRGGLLRRAWEAFDKTPGATRKHWSLRSKDEVYASVFANMDEPQPLAEMAAALHAVLSTASHPRPRVGSRVVNFREDGGITIGTRPTDAQMARQVAALSCAIALDAMERRRNFADLTNSTGPVDGTDGGSTPE